MARRIPKYRHYKPKNLAVVRLRGKNHYLTDMTPRRAGKPIIGSLLSRRPTTANR